MKQILLVEDCAGDVLLVKHVLSLAALPVRLRVAMDGDQALQALTDSDFKPALIILDLNIPRLSGLELLSRCKPESPVVVFSSSSNPTEIQDAMKLGVCEFVQKPNNFDDFSSVVMKMIRDWTKPEGASAEP